MLRGHCAKHGMFLHFAIQMKEVWGFLLFSRMGSDNNSTTTVKQKPTSDCNCPQHLSKMKEIKHSCRGNIFKRHSFSSNWITRSKMTSVQMLCFALLLLLTGFPDSQFVRYSNAQDSSDISPAESSSNTTEGTPDEVVTGDNGPTPMEGESPGGDVVPESPTPSTVSPVAEPSVAGPTEVPPTEAPPTEAPSTEAPPTEAPPTEQQSTPHPCDGVTCANSGTCDVTADNEVYCVCAAGWTGINCTDGT